MRGCCDQGASYHRLERKPINSDDISHAKNADLRASHKALRRAAELARQTTILTDTDLIIVKDGKTIRILAGLLREQTQVQPSLFQ